LATGKTELLPMTELLPRRNCFPNRRSRRLDVSEGADACSVMTSRHMATLNTELSGRARQSGYLAQQSCPGRQD
jgi:hypothetical protein